MPKLLILFFAYLQFQKAMSCLDKKDRQEVLDNDWLKKEVKHSLITSLGVTSRLPFNLLLYLTVGLFVVFCMKCIELISTWGNTRY